MRQCWTHATSLNFVFLWPYAVCFHSCQRKSCKTHTSAKLLRCLLQQRCDNLEAMRHIARPPSLHAAKAAIWQVSCTLSIRTSPPFYFSPQLFVTTSLSLSLLPPPCLVLSLLVFLAPVNIFYLLLSSPLCHPYSSPLVHPPPSRPGSRTETRGSVKIERGMKERKEWGGHNMMISPFLSFCLPPVAFTPLFVCVSSPFVALSPALLSYATNEISTHLTNTCVRTHTHRAHANTNTHTHTMHTLEVLLFLPRAVASEQSCLISVSVGNWGSGGGKGWGFEVGGSPAKGSSSECCCALTRRVIVLHTLIRLMYYCGECASPLPLTHIALPDIQINSKSMSQTELVAI